MTDDFDLPRPAVDADQVMSPKWLAPSRVAPLPVSTGHGLEIPTVLWGVNHAKGASCGSSALIPMGGRCGTDPNLKVRERGHAVAGLAAGAVHGPLQRKEEAPSSCARSIDLTGAF